MRQWYQKAPHEISTEEAVNILQDTEAKQHFPTQYNNLLGFINEQVQELKEKSKEANPLAWFQPSYEQHLKLNAWLYGINYIVDFDANRIGKTAGAVINALLWLIPNEDDWIMFKPFTDHKGRTYQTIPRPSLPTIQRIQKFLKENKLEGNPREPLENPTNQQIYNLLKDNNLLSREQEAPTPLRRKIWIGAPDADFQKEIVMPEWIKWLPTQYIDSHSFYDLNIKLLTPNSRKGTRQTQTTILFKSYDSKDTKWSGAAVDGILLTEGPPKDVFLEVKQRYKTPAFASWDYTPYEPHNTANRSALAHKVFTGEEQLPLKPYIYSGFGIEDAPEHILPDEKKQDLKRMWAKHPQGQARIHGLFYSSSPVVLKNYDPEIHCIPYTLQEIEKQYHPYPLIRFRGLDPGWGHVTACCWVALAPDNTLYVYQYYSKGQRSIEQRSTDIIQQSGNQRIPHPKNKGMWLEKVPPEFPENHIQCTWIDYHTFKTDENTSRPFAENYIRQGLIVRPSLTHGPKERAELLNDLLLPQAHLAHPKTKKSPGSRIYFLINGEGVAYAIQRMTNLFWQTFEKGEKKGLTKDTIQDYDDDELDATCYATLHKFNYSSFVVQREKSIYADSFDSGGQGENRRLSFGDYFQASAK